MISALHSVLGNIGSFGGAIARTAPRLRRLFPILAVLGNVLLAVLLAPNAQGQATGNTTIQPDCLIPFTFAAAGNSPTANVANAQNDNRTRGCAAWTLMYQSTGLTGVSVTLQSGSSVSTTVSYGSFAGTISTGFVNPIVSDAGGSLQAVNGTADISWVRVNVAATGTGTLTGVLYGFRNGSAAVNSGGGTITNIATGCFLTGGPITTTGTISASETVNKQTGTTYAILNSDCGKLVTGTNAGSEAYSIAQAGGGGNFVSGWFIDLQNRGAGTLTLTPATSTVDGAATLVLASGNGVRLVSDGANYFTERGLSAPSVTLNCSTVGADMLYTSSSALACDPGTVTLTPSGGDDTAAIVAVIGSGKNLHLSAGTYIIGTGCSADLFTMSSPIKIEGDGPGQTVLNNRCANHNIFNINYQVAGGGTTVAIGAVIRNFQITQNSGVTATAGAGFLVGSASGAGFYVEGLHIENIQMNNLFVGVQAGTGLISNWFQSLFCIYMKNNCVVVNSAAPSGDNHWNDIESTGSTSGILITGSSADTQEFSNIKVNGSDVNVNVSGSIRFIDPSIEAGTLNCATAALTEVVGGEFALSAVGFAGTAGCSGVIISGAIIRNTTGITLDTSSAAITANTFVTTASAITMANGSGAAITGNIMRGSGVFLTTDATITANLQMAGNVSVVDNSLNAASRVAANTIQNFTTSGIAQGTSTAFVYNTAANCADSAGAAACGAAAAGAFVVDAAATSVVVSTTAVTANSEIFVQFDSSLGTRLGITCNTTGALPAVTARTAATSFTVAVPAAPVTNPACFDYHIVN